MTYIILITDAAYLTKFQALFKFYIKILVERITFGQHMYILSTILIKYFITNEVALYTKLL